MVTDDGDGGDGDDDSGDDDGDDDGLRRSGCHQVRAGPNHRQQTTGGIHCPVELSPCVSNQECNSPTSIHTSALTHTATHTASLYPMAKTFDFQVSQNLRSCNDSGQSGERTSTARKVPTPSSEFYHKPRFSLSFPRISVKEICDSKSTPEFSEKNTSKK